MYDCLALDIGGTNIKYGCFQEEKLVLADQTPVDASGTREQILAPVYGLLAKYPSQMLSVSIPGPFDYRRGISLMTHKFAALKGVCLTGVLLAHEPTMHVRFVHDAAAFLLGEQAIGAAQDCPDAVGITLGTGLGFVRSKEGKLCMRNTLTPSEPLWSKPYRDGIAEDYVSGRGLRKRWQQLTGRDEEVKAIAAQAREGQLQAVRLMRETGRVLGELLSAHPACQGADKIVVGGQIAYAWELMQDSFAETCSIPAVQAEHIADAALWGAFQYALHGNEDFHITED